MVLRWGKILFLGYGMEARLLSNPYKWHFFAETKGQIFPLTEARILVLNLKAEQ